MKILFIDQNQTIEISLGNKTPFVHIVQVNVA
jgi:hypothetical protein